MLVYDLFKYDARLRPVFQKSLPTVASEGTGDSASVPLGSLKDLPLELREFLKAVSSEGEPFENTP